MKNILQAAIFCATAALASTALAADYTLKVSSPTNNDVTLQWMTAFEQKVEAESKGKIDVQLYPANQLGHIPATVEGVSFGTIEVTIPAAGFFVNYDKRFESLSVPGMYKDLAHAQRVLSDPAVLERISSYGNDNGLRTIAAYPHGYLGLLAKNKFDNIDGLKGQKIRIAGPTALNIEPMNALGASPISMPLGEVLPAMQNGSIDGLLAGLPVFVIFKYFDVSKNLTILPESYLVVAAAASTAFLDQIGPELSNIVINAAKESTTHANAWNLKSSNKILDIWKKKGGNIFNLNDKDSQSYIDIINSAIPKAYKENPKLEAEVEFLRATAKRLAQ